MLKEYIRTTDQFFETNGCRPSLLAMIDHKREQRAQRLALAQSLLPYPDDVAEQLKTGHRIRLTLVLQKQINLSLDRLTVLAREVLAREPDRIEHIRVAIPQFVIDKRIFLKLERIKIQDLDQIGRQVHFDQIPGRRRMRKRILEKVVVRRG